MTFTMTLILHIWVPRVCSPICRKGRSGKGSQFEAVFRPSGSSQGKFLLIVSFPVLSAGKIPPVTQELWLQFLPYFHTAFSSREIVHLHWNLQTVICLLVPLTLFSLCAALGSPLIWHQTLNSQQAAQLLGTHR